MVLVSLMKYSNPIYVMQCLLAVRLGQEQCGYEAVYILYAHKNIHDEDRGLLSTMVELGSLLS